MWGVSVALLTTFVIAIIPVYAKGMWNPQSNESYFQIGAEIIRF